MGIWKAVAGVLVMGCAGAFVQAGTITQTLGTSAGFSNGSTTARVATWNTDTAGNPAPFNGFIGSDALGPDFSASWTFSYGAFVGPILDATISFGIYDIDSAASGDQVASFTVGSTDLTATLNGLSEGLNGGTGAVNNEYDIFTITLPAATFTDLLAGSPTFSLALAGPGLGTLGSTTDNGAGIDFSTITIDTGSAVPEPATWLLSAVGLCSIAFLRRLSRA